MARFVIVDDNPDYLELLRIYLTGLGFKNLILFSDPVQAAEYLQTQKADVLISDYEMPGMNGKDLCTLASQLQMPNILMISATMKLDEITSFCRSTGIRFLSKPFELNLLKKILGDFGVLK